MDDLPEAWNEKYDEYLGIRSPSDAEGVLQDIHWSAGLFGYFATYSLGNLYAAQLIAKAKSEMPTLTADFARGDFSSLLAWLRCHVHHHGRCIPAADLVRQVTGEPISSSALMAYLRGKLRAPLWAVVVWAVVAVALRVAGNRIAWEPRLTIVARERKLKRMPLATCESLET